MQVELVKPNQEPITIVFLKFTFYFCFINSSLFSTAIFPTILTLTKTSKLSSRTPSARDYARSPLNLSIELPPRIHALFCQYSRAYLAIALI